MGASSTQFTEFVLGQLAELPGLSSSRFFGGLALKSGAVQFAMIMDGALFFAVDEATRPTYEAMGSRCFSYDTKKGPAEVRKYFEVPADLLEEPARLMDLARGAIVVAGPARKARKAE